jgi:hypothetical protein
MKLIAVSRTNWASSRCGAERLALNWFSWIMVFESRILFFYPAAAEKYTSLQAALV